MEFGKTCEHYRHGYKLWKENVANLILEKTAVHPDDLPDFNYRERFELGHTSTHTANEYLKKIKYTDAFHYWMKYVKNEYLKQKKINLNDDLLLEKMFKKKITCYKVVDELIK